VKQDIDPDIQAEEVREESPDTLKAVSDEWIERQLVKKKKRRKRTLDEYRRILDKEILALPDKYISEIKRSDILLLTDRIVDRGAPALANKVSAILKSLFKWAVQRG
jgi:hypothetical protein